MIWIHHSSTTFHCSKHTQAQDIPDVLLCDSTIPRRSNDSITQEHTVARYSVVAQPLVQFCFAIAAFGLTEKLDLWIVEGSGKHNNTAIEQRTGRNNLSMRPVTYRYSS